MKVIPKFDLEQTIYYKNALDPYMFTSCKVYWIKIEFGGAVYYQTDMKDHTGKQAYDYLHEDQFYATPEEAVEALMNLHVEMLEEGYKRHIKQIENSAPLIAKCKEILARIKN